MKIHKAKWTKGLMNELASEGVHEGVNEWVHEQMSKWVTKWMEKSVRKWKCAPCLSMCGDRMWVDHVDLENQTACGACVSLNLGDCSFRHPSATQRLGPYSESSGWTPARSQWCGKHSWAHVPLEKQDLNGFPFQKVAQKCLDSKTWL